MVLEINHEKSKENIEKISWVSEELSFLKEEINYCGKYPEYKALYNKENNIKDKIDDFDKLWQLTLEAKKWNSGTPIDKEMKEAIFNVMLKSKNIKKYEERLDIHNKRIELHKKIRKQEKK